jgi:hypothetical protein
MLYAKIRDLSNHLSCIQSSECTVNPKNNKPVLACDTSKYSYCKDFNYNQKGNNWKKRPPYVKYEGCYYDNKCTNQNHYIAPIKTVCEDSDKALCEYNDDSPTFHKNCMEARYGKGNDPNICFVGDSDPCNLMDSGEDYSPKICKNICCPGNQNKCYHTPYGKPCYPKKSACCKTSDGKQPHCKPAKPPGPTGFKCQL